MRNEQIILELDGETNSLKIGGECSTLDIMLSMLERAHRELEARYRFQKAQELAAQAAENFRLSALTRDPAKLRV